MLTPLALLLPLSVSLSPAPAPLQDPVVEAPEAGERAAAAVTYEELVAAHETAYADWRARRKAEGRAAAGPDPTETYWSDFVALADSGEGRALLWMMKNARKAGLRSKENTALRTDCVERLVRDHADAPWFGEALPKIFSHRKKLGLARYEELVKDALPRIVEEEDRALALVGLAQAFSRSKDEAEREKGFAYYERLFEEYPDTQHAMMARGEYVRVRYLADGMVAPDFEGTTAEGESFKLSDHRGKIVLVDFWGFW
jgi:hypothetical protein